MEAISSPVGTQVKETRTAEDIIEMRDPVSVPPETVVAPGEEEYEEVGCCNTDFEHVCTMVGVVSTALNMVLMLAVYIYFVYDDEDDARKTTRQFSGWKP